MNEQRLLDQNWFKYCEACGERLKEDWGDLRKTCDSCSAKEGRQRAIAIGLPVTDEMPDDTVLGMLDNCGLICRYVTLVWNDSVSAKHRQPIIKEGDTRWPWSPDTALFVPEIEIEKTSAEICVNDELSEAVFQEIYTIHAMHLSGSTSQVDPRYDTGQKRIVSSYWPSANRNETYQRIADMLWKRWQRFLPFSVIGSDTSGETTKDDLSN